MKYIFILLLTSLLFAGVAFAEESPFNNKHKMKPLVYTECHEGFLFIVASSQSGVAIMQVFKDVGDMVPKPVECDKDE